MFKDVPSKFDFPAMEREILAFWEVHHVYEQSLEKSKGGKPFVFFEGPPTANGMPHPGHCLTRAIKDLFPRYKTMTGHYCLRKAGWDTHGLPVEVEVCKELGIHTKEEIEAYGVEAFNRKCLESVFRYTREWEEMTRRLGFWINLEEAYVTYHQSYIESVWWSLKQLFDAGLLYQGHKIVWWWAQGGTALSAGEVGQGYREVDDPSVFVRFPLVEDERYTAMFSRDQFSRDPQGSAPDRPPSLLVWTTTPWTLPSNMFAAVHNDFDYCLVLDEVDGERLIFAAKLFDTIAKKLKATKRWKIVRKFKGSDLIHLRYEPPFPDCYYHRAASHGAAFRGLDDDWDSLGGYEPLPIGPWGDHNATLRTGGLQHIAWRVVPASFVTLDTGSGVVHQAPAFGEDDFKLLEDERSRFAPGSFGSPAIPLLCAVKPNGTFTKDVGDKYAGRWVKDCDKEIIQDMKERGVLVLHEQYRHDYPFCWRAEEDPLIQYPRKSWFIRTTQFKEDMLENNQQINWLPDHIKGGRFGKFLETNVDWALSRERYWGTPLPIWVCDACGHTEAVDSYAALTSKPGVQGLKVWEDARKADPTLSDHLKVHKPYIDAITYACPKCALNQSRDRQGAVHGNAAGYPRSQENPSLTVGALNESRGSEYRMRRVPDVIDCWFDSGAMPFAQWGYPHKNAEVFSRQFPADFISEALDQTRGWFYSLTAISVMLFGKNGVARDAAKRGERNPQSEYPQPFRTCIVLGLIMGEDGLKMSKSKKNYKDPDYIFEHEGADAMRWLFFSGQPPWTSIRFQEGAIAEGQREFLIRLYNCYSFFVIYAKIDQWTPDQSRDREGAVGATIANVPPGQGRGLLGREAYTELDRWIISELNRCCGDVYRHMEAYDNYDAAKALSAFVDALSNWYVRRSRERFWRSGMDDDKKAAYATLHECLVTLAKLIAPFTPFFAESLYQNLVRAHDANAPLSVHLCEYPITEATRPRIEAAIDRELNAQVEDVRQLVSCGRAARSAAKIRVRQPLAGIEFYHRDDQAIRTHEEVIKEELNVKRIEYVGSAEIDKYVQYEVKPDFKKIGPKFGPLAPKIKTALASSSDIESIVKSLENDGKCALAVGGETVELTADELVVELHAKEGWTAERIPGRGIIVLDAHLTPELIDEGIARDLVNQIQQTRKNLDLQYTQRINLAIVGDDDIRRVVNGFGAYIMRETLAEAVLSQRIPNVEPVKADIDGHSVDVFVKPM